MLFTATLAFFVIWCLVSFIVIRRCKLGWVYSLVGANIILTVLARAQNPFGFDRFETMFWIAAIWFFSSVGMLGRMSLGAQPAKKPEGYIVISHDDRYLDRYGNWRQHSDIKEAYVHPKAVLLRNSDLIGLKASLLIQARYNQSEDTTEIIDPRPIPWGVFLDQTKDATGIRS